VGHKRGGGSRNVSKFSEGYEKGYWVYNSTGLTRERPGCSSKAVKKEKGKRGSVGVLICGLYVKLKR